jgi:septum site-determining protein MinC
MGDKEAMIFCRSLEAELVSIAGQYRLSEDLKEICWKQPACIQLQDDRLNIRPV